MEASAAATVTPLGGDSGYALVDKATLYDFDVANGATANSMTVKRTTWTGGTVRGGANSTDRLFVDLNFYDTLNNVTFTTDAADSATGICLVSAGANGGVYLNDVTVKNFAYLEYVRGSANNLTILDGARVGIRLKPGVVEMSSGMWVKLGGSVNKLTKLVPAGPRDILEEDGILYDYNPLLDGNTGSYFNTLVEIEKMSAAAKEV